jgi:hypothetical protein
MTFEFRRSPAVEKKIKDINPENDIRVRLLGSVIDKQEGLIVLDDGTGKADISLEDPEKINVSDTVRIFARVIPLEENYELKGEVIQSISGDEMELYKKILEN